MRRWFGLSLLAGCIPNPTDLAVDDYLAAAQGLRDVLSTHQVEVQTAADLPAVGVAEGALPAAWEAARESLDAEAEALTTCEMSDAHMASMADVATLATDMDALIDAHAAAHVEHEAIAECLADEDAFQADLDARLSAIGERAEGWRDQMRCIGEGMGM